MKQVLLILCIVITSCLGNNNNAEINYSRKIGNDSICYNKVDVSIDSRLSFIKACHINYSDSLDSIMAFALASNRIPFPYNFQRDDSLVYEQNGNNIDIKILHVANINNYELKPWKIIYSNDTLYLSAIAKDTSNRIFTSTFRFGELYYQFKKNSDFKLVVKMVDSLL